MSQENVELLPRGFAGTTAGDFSYLSDAIHEDCEFRLPPDFPGTQDARGAEGFLSVVREFEDVFEDTRYEPEDFVDQGDRLFVAVRTTGRAKHTGIPLDVFLYWVYTFREGKVVQMWAFLDRAAALEAVGLSE